METLKYTIGASYHFKRIQFSVFKTTAGISKFFQEFTFDYPKNFRIRFCSRHNYCYLTLKLFSLWSSMPIFKYFFVMLTDLWLNLIFLAFLNSLLHWFSVIHNFWNPLWQSLQSCRHALASLSFTSPIRLLSIFNKTSNTKTTAKIFQNNYIRLSCFWQFSKPILVLLNGFYYV